MDSITSCSFSYIHSARSQKTKTTELFHIYIYTAKAAMPQERPHAAGYHAPQHGTASQPTLLAAQPHVKALHYTRGQKDPSPKLADITHGTALWTCDRYAPAVQYLTKGQRVTARRHSKAKSHTNTRIRHGLYYLMHIHAHTDLGSSSTHREDKVTDDEEPSDAVSSRAVRRRSHFAAAANTKTDTLREKRRSILASQ